ncbi:MAG: Dam family site-specific DNA-(adenine-N6)-methyltransferase [Ruminococcaceae bacterium]|nr:Dam family site-specific DNA-(adenine-N6)-methyltransferase [Oscillospiraceae bacterium]
MEYMSAKEAAENWGISQRRVAVLCSEKRIPRATMIGNMWLIPKNSVKPEDGRSLRYVNESKAKPFIKWAGGKSQLLTVFRKFYPSGLGTTIKKYAEPFVGGGAVLFDILTNYNLNEVYICDNNSELITTYLVLRDNIDDLIDLLSEYQSVYLPLSNDLRKSYYYKKRMRFNELKHRNEADIEIASLFIFLNKTCFNGLYRVNSKGEFNVPIGAYKNPTICDEINLLRVSKILTKVNIETGDYRISRDFIDSDTFVYIDPPYRPLSSTSSFTSYTSNSFNDKDQIELSEFVHEISDLGAFILASNSDPKNTDPKDNFFDDLYSDMKIERISASRMINSDGKGRKRISELLIRNY